MPRVARASAGGVCYHVLNRGNGGTKIFRTTRDYTDFVELLREETETRNVRLLAYCLLPDHFHMVLWPRKDGDLSYWMQWLLTSHVRRYHSLHGTSGHVWAGRFRAFPIQANEYLLTVLRYIEQNPLRLKELKLRAPEQWCWSSAVAEIHGVKLPRIDPGPVERGRNWLKSLQTPLTAEELALVRHSVVRGTPLGDAKWQQRIVAKLGLEATMRPRGRPRKTPVV
jgi:putative transposase